MALALKHYANSDLLGESTINQFIIPVRDPREITRRSDRIFLLLFFVIITERYVTLSRSTPCTQGYLDTDLNVSIFYAIIWCYFRVRFDFTITWW